MPINKISICHLRVELKRLEQAMIRYEVAIDAQLAGEPDVAYRRQVKERDVSFYAGRERAAIRRASLDVLAGLIELRRYS